MDFSPTGSFTGDSNAQNATGDHGRDVLAERWGPRPAPPSTPMVAVSLSPRKPSMPDWAPGNGITPGGDHSAANPGATFNDVTLAQAKLWNGHCGWVTVFNGNAIPELTYRISIPEVTTVVNNTLLGFSTDPGAAAASNWIEIYSDTAKTRATQAQTTSLATGFGDGPGDVLIMYGIITTVSGEFCSEWDVELFDQFGADNYGGQQTIVGGGGTTIRVSVAT